jgi:hypothetical protein
MRPIHCPIQGCTQLTYLNHHHHPPSRPQPHRSKSRKLPAVTEFPREGFEERFIDADLKEIPLAT